MSRFSKIVIFISLILLISGGFIVSHFSFAQNGESNQNLPEK